MRYRDYRNFHQGGIYHIYNRGNNRGTVFFDPEDYRAFIYRLKLLLGLSEDISTKLSLKQFNTEDFSIIAYCLMPTHYHLIIKQNNSTAISKLMLKLATSYCMYFNKKYDRVGSVFQDQFKAKDITNDPYLKILTAYVHNNPENPYSYPYSSLTEYLKRIYNICDKQACEQVVGEPFLNYQPFFENYIIKTRQTEGAPL